MDTFDAVQAASHAISQITADGFEVEVTSNFEAIPDVVRKMGKPHLTPLLSPLSHDFTTRTAFWIILRKQDGSAAGCVGAKLEVFDEGEIAGYWQRIFPRHYPDVGKFEVTLSSSASEALVGRLAYIGDLYIEGSPNGGLARQNAKRLSSLLHLVHALVTLEWNVDAAYSFISSKDALRGAGVRYGFTVQIPFQKGWNGAPPPNRYDDEWLVILPAADRPAAFRRQALSNS